ncbi:ArdC family protein [Bacillus paramobilis]|uniref:ArdC family protein n=1 Tax=Bacillus paramobilis TaxID=2817477 RepID=UPI001BB436CD|nr:ArdC family protein [Bacillus paramobilis]HEF5065760.1 hypothetical protein [Bacillus cereus]HEF5237744.1 hypothetical protein [Bacillus cereus]
MTNEEMIMEAAGMVGYHYDGENLKTFAEWKKAGFSIIKGETACMKLDLWKPFTKKLVDENGKPELDEEGKQKEETRFKLVPSSLFAIEQVQKLDLSKVKAKAKAKPKRKAVPKKKTA